MPATPRRARNFGGSSQHQKLMMANLAASLIAAEAHRHHRGQGQGAAPDRREAHHQGQEGPGRRAPMRVHRIRQIQGYLGDQEMTHKLVNEVAPRYEDRNGGYLRILKLGPRQGDNAPMARIELV